VYTEPLDPTRAKNIVICADGTGNADVKGRGSNVFKLFEAVDTTSHLYDLSRCRQIAFYDEGVGTESWWPRRILGAGLGIGLKQNTCELYQEIARVYQPGDRLYLFGFSRGGFTVRALAAMIDCCGILVGSRYETRRALTRDVSTCYDYFLAAQGGSTRDFPSNFARHPRAGAPIEFLGVWDTVDAVGLSFKSVARWINGSVWRFKADVTRLPASVRFACQALALDDERQAFTPEVWAAAHNIEQVWFAGVHSDIGGGYPRQGLSLIPLQWMMTRAEARGLRFVESDREYYREHQIVADKVHDPRTGAAVAYRWKPRNVAELSREAGTPHVHITVFDRLAQAVEGYALYNLPEDVVIAFTSRADWEHLNPGAIHEALTRHAAILSKATALARPVILGGVWAYWLFVAGVLITLFGVTSSIWMALVGAVALVSAWAWSAATDRAMDRIFSSAWHKIRPSLRDALSRHAVSAVPQAPAGTAVTVGGISSPVV
jgi:uncharacterized protein (DUF2235 family)